MALRGRKVAIGVLFSASGPYAAIGAEGLAGTILAIDEINASGQHDFVLEAQVRDPQGATENYAALAADIVATSGARHIIGCTTSWSRKEVIPLLEKSNTMLWYPCPYEGFEAHEQVIYLGACPNQHVLPLLEFALPRFGADGYLVGSNYIWGWETSRIARDAMEAAGGRVAGERYVPLGDVDVDRIIEEIRLKRPSFILNTLIGPSSYAFLKAYAELGRADSSFQAALRPVLSCNFSEPELAQVGAAAEGQIAVSPYFQNLATEENQQFLGVVARLAPETEHVSAFFAQAYAAVHLLAAGLSATGTDDTKTVLGAVAGRAVSAPFGPMEIERSNNHAVLTPRIARATSAGFEIVADQCVAIRPDPYLAHVATRSAPHASHLRVVK
ncbi:transporter substrate-binding domain-containing protein [Devosia psychrophila]|uniref:Branched-chain amino acid transport system substrate-binding protein n=2 Tax=Devosia psychrophila TaxID=728005 RepID=A0A0F5PY26_9HYPH|nr:transporter substrate-binding domain-containing protein [Devosia psychrophila]KKC32729.1 regulatory protein [Devosia psychrophila]SFC53582.1 branched-chain amino acid transport system substrate-binding protein [Devosia psychrophila]